jgi:hypothetical protein
VDHAAAALHAMQENIFHRALKPICCVYLVLLAISALEPTANPLHGLSPRVLLENTSPHPIQQHQTGNAHHVLSKITALEGLYPTHLAQQDGTAQPTDQ